MKKIILPTDFSANADNAIHYALRMFGTEAEYILLHSFEMPALGAGTLAYLNDILYSEIKEDLKKKYHSLIENPAYKGINISMTAEIGEPATVIAEVAKKEEADLIIMGTKGASGLKEFLLGSNTFAVIQRTPCAVLAIPENAYYTLPEKIVFASDLKPYKNEDVLQPLITLAKRFGSKLLVINVKRSHEENGVLSENPLNGYLKGFTYSMHSVENIDIETGISDFMHKEKATLLAVVTRRHNFFGKLLRKSISGQLAMHTDIPMLVMNEVKREAVVH